MIAKNSPNTLGGIPAFLVSSVILCSSAAFADNTSKFEAADLDQSGSLDFTEFSSLSNKNQPEKQVLKKFDRADADGDDAVTLAEWLDFKSDLKEDKMDLKKYTAQFEDADSDGDGFLTYDEFIPTVPGKKPLIEVRKRFLKIDRDLDALISLDEWLDYRNDTIEGDWENPKKFDLADLDGNEELSEDEFATTYPRKTKLNTILKKFHKIDDNDDGVLTRDEWNPGKGKDKGKKKSGAA